MLLSRAYRDGCGVTRSSATASEWAMHAANRSKIAVGTRVGKWLHKSLGIKRDYAASHSFLRKATDKCHAEAQKELAYFYYLGLGGIRKYAAEADRLMSLAARAGDPEGVVQSTRDRKLQELREKIERQKVEKAAAEAHQKF